MRTNIDRWLVAAGLLIGTGLLTWGIAADGRVGRDDLLTIGFVVMLAAAVMELRRPRQMTTDRAIDRAIRAGWFRGHAEGRKTARPVVVKANCPNCGENLYRAS